MMEQLGWSQLAIKSRDPRLVLFYSIVYNHIRRETVRNFVPYLCQLVLRRHLVGKTLRNVCHCVVT